MTRDVATFLRTLLLQQSVPVGDPQFPAVSALIVRALGELDAIIDPPQDDDQQ